jgi:myosin heavy subunit
MTTWNDTVPGDFDSCAKIRETAISGNFCTGMHFDKMLDIFSNDDKPMLDHIAAFQTAQLNSALVHNHRLDEKLEKLEDTLLAKELGIGTSDATKLVIEDLTTTLDSANKTIQEIKTVNAENKTVNEEMYAENVRLNKDLDKAVSEIKYQKAEAGKLKSTNRSVVQKNINLEKLVISYRTGVESTNMGKENKKLHRQNIALGENNEELEVMLLDKEKTFMKLIEELEELRGKNKLMVEKYQMMEELKKELKEERAKNI